MLRKYEFFAVATDNYTSYSFEKSMKSRREAFQRIDTVLQTKFFQKYTENLSISDQIVRKWAMMANNELMENKIHDFRASKGWLTAFKHRHRISSRKVIFLQKIIMYLFSDYNIYFKSASC